MIYWLTKIAGRDDYLAGLGATPDIIQFIMSQPEQQSQFLTNEFRKNPSITLQELQYVIMPEKQSPYLQQEMSFADILPSDDLFKKWTLVQLKKHRRRDSVSINDNPVYDSEFAARYGDFGSRLSLGGMYNWILMPISHWYMSTQPEIASYTLEAAYAATKQWEQASRGEGDEVYDGTDQVVYSWKEGAFAGWSIKKIMTQNNAIVEGNLMSHCVGDCKYEDGKIYDHYQHSDVELFSLRDAKDHPHVTIELSAIDNNIQNALQIYGPGNSQPKSEYRELIREWFAAFKNELYSQNDFDFSPRELKNYYARNLVAKAQELVYGDGDPDEYGLRSRPVDIAEIDIEDMHDVFIEVLTENSSHYVDHHTQSAAEWLMQLAWDADKKWMQENCGMDEQYFQKRSKVEQLCSMEEKSLDEFDRWFEYNEPMPDEDDFKTPEEYKAAYAEWEEQELESRDDSMLQSMPVAFDYHMVNYLWKNLHENDKSYTELKSRCIKSNQNAPQSPIPV